MTANIPHPLTQGRAAGAAQDDATASALPLGIPVVSAAVLLAVGLALRALPFAAKADAFMRRFPSEDGYLSLTIARNIALGRGMSTAEGTLPTNGTQPLVTLLWSLPFRLVDGDRQLGVMLVLILEIAISLLAARALYLLGLRVLSPRRHAAEASLLAAGLWYASPLVIPHSMNCLESGAYALVTILVARVFVEAANARAVPWSLRRCLGAGVLLGAAFWTRNDAVFLIAAACVVHLHAGLASGPAALRARFGRTLLFGSTSVLVAAPWLVHNYLRFGHIMPVSGRAESHGATFGSNLAGVPATLFEHASSLIAIPARISQHPGVVIGCTLLLLLGALLLRPLWAVASPPERSLIVLAGVFMSGLVVFYGLFFGAMHFLNRYFFPLSPFFALLWSALLLHLTRGAALPAVHRVLRMAPIAAIVWVTAIGARDHIAHRDHEHFHVVEWVRANVPEGTWIGAIQTGTLGFFYERAINLDGKVNAAAYEAMAAGRHGEYVAQSKIQYLPDWIAILDWMKDPAIARHFEVVEVQRERNLAVLRRRPSAHRHATRSSAHFK